MKKTALETICIASFCRSYLYFANFLTDSESEKVQRKIRKYQDKHRQNVKIEDLNSVHIVMGDYEQPTEEEK